MSNLSQQPARRATLANLLSGIDAAPVPRGSGVSDLKLDSRKVVKGDLFVALKGYRDDGVQYIESAVERGASAVLVEAETLVDIGDCKVPLVGVKELKANVSKIAGRFFSEPSKQLEVIGVTGTNGKTSCCQFIAKALTYLGIDCGLIGTLGYGLVGALNKTENTTPDAIAMQRILADMVDQKLKAVALEVSSHGMEQGRVNGIHFDSAVFTNLSRDHLDYHGSMTVYAECKRQFFLLPGIKHAIVNVDDEFGRQLADKMPDRIALFRYGVESQDADITVSNLEFSARGIYATLYSPWGEGILTSSLLGRFNLSNLLAVIGVLCAQGISLPRVLEAVKHLSTVPGRMERFGGGGLPTVIVDYAHTPDALERVLVSLRELCSGELWCVFGCGGERDRGKRAMMGEVAERLADQLVLTNDNPRTEAPQQIITDIQSGLRKPAQTILELDRALAIQMAIHSAHSRDLILVAGKGHEHWQEVKGARIAFSDAEQVKQALNIKRSMEEASRGK